MRYKTTTRIPFELSSPSKQDLSDAPKDTTEAAVAFYTDKRASNTLPSDMYTLTDFDELKRYIQYEATICRNKFAPTKKKLSQLANNLPTLA